MSDGTTDFYFFANLLLCIKMFYPKIFIPDKDIVIRRHDVRMQKPFGVPPMPRFMEKAGLSIN